MGKAHERLRQELRREMRRRGIRPSERLNPEQRRRINELLVAELKALGFSSLRNGRSGWWWAGRFRYRKACAHVATRLPWEVRRLLKRKKVTWRTVARHTRDAFPRGRGSWTVLWFLRDAEREPALLNRGLMRDL